MKTCHYIFRHISFQKLQEKKISLLQQYRLDTFCNLKIFIIFNIIFTRNLRDILLSSFYISGMLIKSISQVRHGTQTNQIGCSRPHSSHLVGWNLHLRHQRPDPMIAKTLSLDYVFFQTLIYYIFTQ